MDFLRSNFLGNETLLSLVGHIQSSKLDFPLIKTLERIRFSSNQNIGEGESNFDGNVPDQRLIQKQSTTYK